MTPVCKANHFLQNSQSLIKNLTMEAPEVPVEELQEKIHEKAHHSSEKWIMSVALTSAIFATLAAIGSLLAGHHANEAILDQLKSSNQWAYYQAKGIKANVLNSKIELLTELGKDADQKDQSKLEQYQKDQERIRESAEETERDSANHMAKHMVLARCITLFQVGIAIAAISVLVGRRRYWYVSLGLGAAGLIFLLQGIFLTA